MPDLQRPSDAAGAGALDVRTWLLALAILGGTVALYLSTFEPLSDAVVYGGIDVVGYARALAEDLAWGHWNPHHLLFHPLARLLASLMSGGDIDFATAMRAQQIVSAAAGGLAAALLFAFAARLGGRLEALGLALLHVFAAGNWLYGSVGENYLCASAATAALLSHACRPRLHGEPASIPVLASWLLLAVLFRQDAVLVVVALPFLLRWRRWAPAVAIAAALTLGLYAVGWKLSGSPAAFFDWLRGFSLAGVWGAAPDAERARLGLKALGGSLAFVTLRYPWMGAVTWGVLLLALSWRPRRVGSGPVLLGMLLFVLVRCAFFLWWEPGNLEVHSATLLPLLMLMALLVGRPAPGSRLKVDVFLLAAVVLVVAGNVVALVLPFRGAEAAAHADRARAEAGEGGMVVWLDYFQLAALTRAQGPATLEDGASVPVVSRYQRRELDARMGDTLAAGGNVVFARDVVIARHLDREWSVGAYGPLVFEPGLPVELVKDEDGEIWLSIVRAPAHDDARPRGINGRALAGQPAGPFRFFVGGHLYGRPERAAPHPAETLRTSLLHLVGQRPAFLVALGDVFYDVKAQVRPEEQGRPEEQARRKTERDVYDKVPFPIFNAPGNHDLTSRAAYVARFGRTWSSFRYGPALIVLLDTEREPWRIAGRQLDFLRAEIRRAESAPGITSVFFFAHRVLFGSRESLVVATLCCNAFQELAIFLGDPERARSFDVDVRPELERLARTRDVYWFAGDVGAFPDRSLTLFHEREAETGITFIATGIGDRPDDAIIQVDIDAAGRARLTPVSLTRNRVEPIEQYGHERWEAKFLPNGLPDPVRQFLRGR